jgi:glutaredoxin
MTTRKKIKVFSAGCSTCNETIELVKRLAGSSHEVVIHDMHQSDIASKAKHYGIRSVPAVVVDGKLAGCCADRGPDDSVLRSALAQASNRSSLSGLRRTRFLPPAPLGPEQARLHGVFLFFRNTCSPDHVWQIDDLRPSHTRLAQQLPHLPEFGEVFRSVRRTLHQANIP